MVAGKNGVVSGGHLVVSNGVPARFRRRMEKREMEIVLLLLNGCFWWLAAISGGGWCVASMEKVKNWRRVLA
uniref:Putative ovule protein n=1 Tax=Solanum chacoense TaxID=4108 RepID=A0A0V0HFZ7_SOLCH